MKIILDSSELIIKIYEVLFLDNFSVGLVRLGLETSEPYTQDSILVLCQQLGSMISEANNKHIICLHFLSISNRYHFLPLIFIFFVHSVFEGDDQLNEFIWMHIEYKHSNNDWTERNQKPNSNDHIHGSSMIGRLTQGHWFI